MCGIFGYYQKSVSGIKIQSIANQLFKASESRGKEASGIALVTHNTIEILKSAEPGSHFIRTNAYKSLPWRRGNHKLGFIGHSRLATNGASTDNNNNQPVITPVALGVHNGIIVNTNDLWSRFPQIRRQYEVDSEIIFSLLGHFNEQYRDFEHSVRELYKMIEGAASIAVLFKNTRHLLLSTNTGSLYYTRANGCFLFASEESIVRSTQNRLAETVATAPLRKLTPGTGVILNLRTLNSSVFYFTGNRNPPKRIISQDWNFRINDHTQDSRNKSFNLTLYRPLNTMNKLKEHQPDYKKIEKLRRCERCILPETMPFISFDRDGICNYCLEYRPQKPLGLETLKSVILSYRQRTGSNKCILAFSGGRDSSFGLHVVKTVLELDPIAYTYDWGMVTDVARRNQSRITAKLGVEQIIVSADIQKKRTYIRKNVEAWLKKPDIGMVSLFMAGDKQAEYYAEQVGKKTGVELIIYCRGNQLEDERFKFGHLGIYDGTPSGVLHNLSLSGKVSLVMYCARQTILNPSYINQSLLDTFFAYFSSYLMKYKFYYLWHFIPWNEQEIVQTLITRYGWETAPDTTSTWRIDDGTPPFYNYIYYRVQGFSEHDALRSNQIREGIMTRKQALDRVLEENKPRYESLKWYFDSIGIDGDRALSVVDEIQPLY